MRYAHKFRESNFCFENLRGGGEITKLQLYTPLVSFSLKRVGFCPSQEWVSVRLRSEFLSVPGVSFCPSREWVSVSKWASVSRVGFLPARSRILSVSRTRFLFLLKVGFCQSQESGGFSVTRNWGSVSLKCGFLSVYVPNLTINIWLYFINFFVTFSTSFSSFFTSSPSCLVTGVSLRFWSRCHLNHYISYQIQGSHSASDQDATSNIILVIKYGGLTPLLIKMPPQTLY